MLDATFQDMGIPVGYRVRQLLFNPVVDALVVQMQSATDSWRPERLYFRHAKDSQYRPIGRLDDTIAEECPFVHPTRPLLAYNRVRHSFSMGSEGEEFHSGDWDSLRIFDLERGAEVESADGSSLQLLSGIKAAWICEIVAFGESGLFVKVALGPGGGSSRRFEYAVAQLDLPTRRLIPLVDLPLVFL